MKTAKKTKVVSWGDSHGNTINVWTRDTQTGDLTMTTEEKAASAAILEEMKKAMDAMIGGLAKN